MAETLHIFSAGVVMGLAGQLIEKWNGDHPELPAVLSAGGSVDLIRRALAGEPCDVLISADDAIIASLMMPRHADGYVIFAGNKMVVTATPGHEITSQDWKEKLLAPTARFAHFNPQADPGGYRAVLSLMLADNYEKGLSAKLLNHPGHITLADKPQPGQKPDFDYMFGYYSGARSRHIPLAELPPVMDLSDDSLAQLYSSVEIKLDDKNVVQGSPIAHALTIPKAARCPEAAKDFAGQFLRTDFAAHHFIPRNKIVGAGLDRP
ncbi:MAG: substrate-binding domain-containing protein [Candidatus Adiutrix sp.]|jgi:molybdate/tungstate transport system substrate-binding protein|nr:substrate-binding domain-containing protein [Candidatus Adiutrix sp.]